MNVGDRHYRTIWLSDDGRSVEIIDQRWLPHDFRIETIGTVAGIATAIRDMWVRGAPLIGVTAAYGVALQIAHDRYRPGSVAEKFAAANARSAFICLIETADGVKNIDGIAALDGVDCLWVGHFDLSVSLGIPGQFDHPDFLAAMDRIVKAAKKHKKSLGRLVPNVQQGIDYHAQGFDFICYSGDVWLLGAAVREGVRAIREGVGAAEAKPAARKAGAAGGAPAKAAAAKVEAPASGSGKRRGKATAPPDGGTEASRASSEKPSSTRRRGGRG